MKKIMIILFSVFLITEYASAADKIPCTKMDQMHVDNKILKAPILDHNYKSKTKECRRMQVS